MTTTRRQLLAAACAAPLALVAPTAGAAGFAADGPARVRPGALKSNLLDVAAAGQRFIAVGERGHVLLSDDGGKAWRQARTVPTRTTLTSVHATDEKTLWAAGHGGVILRSADAGETWTVAAGSADGADVLLAIRVQPDGQGLAVGGFGTALATSDGGATWRPGALVDGEAGDKHLNRLWVTAAGTWLIAAEGGVVLRREAGASAWAVVKTPYNGSLWTGLALPAGGVLLAGGMRGNVVRSTDDGRSWAHHPVAGAGSLAGAAVLPDGRPLLVGVDGTQLLGDAAGTTLRLRRLDDRATLTGVAVLGPQVVAATAAGMRVLAPFN